MKEGWKYKPFGEVFPIKMGKTPPRGDKSCWDTKKESENKWVSISDISQNEGKVIFDTKEYITDAAAEKIFRVKANSLLMSFKLTIGKMAFAGTDLYTNEAIIAIPDNKEYNLKFLYFYLSSYNWSSLTDGNEKVKGKTLNKESIGRIKLPIISLPDQQRIVTYLDAEFAKIEALKANAEKQLQAAKDLFQAALKELMTPKEGWVEKNITQLAENLDSKRIPITSHLRKKGIYPYYGASGIVDYVADYIFDDDLLLISEDGANLLARSTPIAFSVSGKIWVNNHAHIFKFTNMCTQKYVEYYFASINVSEYVTGAAQPKLAQKMLNRIPISIPDNIKEQKAIVSQLDKIYVHCQSLEGNYTETITFCNDLKQALLKQVFG